MKECYYLDIEFPGVDFNKYHIKCDDVSRIHTAHLYTHENEIELRIFYADKTYLGRKISLWSQRIEWRKFGSFIKVSNENKNERMRKIDLSESKLCGIQDSTTFYDGNARYVVIKLDSVKFYWNPVKEEVNTAEFFLHDVGFRVVEPFYSFLFGYNGKFNISRMNGKDIFYTFGKSIFRPEFRTYSKDGSGNRVATVIKEPKIQFKYTAPVSEEEAIYYGDVVRLLASFYYHINPHCSKRLLNR
jgi:hypothetical protein